VPGKFERFTKRDGIADIPGAAYPAHHPNDARRLRSARAPGGCWAGCDADVRHWTGRMKD